MAVTVSIIIVNWNGEQFLHDCFHSLKDQTFKDFEIIFVDNASVDKSVEAAKTLASDLGLPLNMVQLETNTGFAKGNNEGLKHSSGRYIALLNNDTVASERWLESLVEAMDNHSDVGICASKLVVAGTDIIDSAGDGFYTDLRAFKRGEGEPVSSYSIQEYIFGACAGAALYRKTMIDEIGLFDEDYFLILEDIDLSFRAQLAGWKCLFVPNAVVQHKVNASLKKLGQLSHAHEMRNEKATIMKNVPSRLLLKYLPFYLLEEVVFSFYYNIKDGRLKTYLRGNYEFFRNLPSYMKKRRQVIKLRKVTAGYIDSTLTPVSPIFKKKFEAKIHSVFKRGRDR
jgi:GT2 family glycosyltransferase